MKESPRKRGLLTPESLIIFSAAEIGVESSNCPGEIAVNAYRYNGEPFVATPRTSTLISHISIIKRLSSLRWTLPRTQRVFLCNPRSLGATVAHIPCALGLIDRSIDRHVDGRAAGGLDVDDTVTAPRPLLPMARIRARRRSTTRGRSTLSTTSRNVFVGPQRCSTIGRSDRPNSLRRWSGSGCSRAVEGAHAVCAGEPWLGPSCLYCSEWGPRNISKNSEWGPRI